MQILFQVNNLTNEPYIAYSENKQRVLDYQEYGTSVSMDRVVIFGGQKQSVRTLCDMYSWDGVDWKLITATNQGPCVHSASMAWDTRSATSPRLIVANGYVDVNDTQNTDVWYFKFSTTTSGTWALASPPPCAPRGDAMGAFDR